MAKVKKIETTIADLGKILSEKRKALMNLGFKGAGSKVANVREGRALRRDIARALTSVNKK